MIQRVGRNHYDAMYQQDLLNDPNAVCRRFDLFDDQRYQEFVNLLDVEIKKSAAMGLLAWKKKELRDPIEPHYLRKVFELDWVSVPVYLEYVTVVNVMLLLKIRGGRELAEDLNWAQFKQVNDENGRQLFWEYNPNDHGGKQRSGGVRTFRIVRDKVHVEYL